LKGEKERGGGKNLQEGSYDGSNASAPHVDSDNPIFFRSWGSWLFEGKEQCPEGLF